MLLNIIKQDGQFNDFIVCVKLANDEFRKMSLKKIDNNDLT